MLTYTPSTRMLNPFLPFGDRSHTEPNYTYVEQFLAMLRFERVRANASSV
jgi:hypothetical protein